ncbi:hypothetical protein [Ruminococcus sp.]|uniref:hypothetical protein n=1 Tax=Ruminococcus sp. TaxID=41978 RepID=UPI0025D6EB71|nr:hypothetical protein [Ruminococcus sp.]MCR4639522.1 hypothetical protein [Ruminococcus sp.]
MSKSISVDFCSSFCKHRHSELRDGWLSTCDAYPNGTYGNENYLFEFKRECANGVGFEPNERANPAWLKRRRERSPWVKCVRDYLQFGTPGKCGHCHSDTIHVYSDAPLTTIVTFVCYGCGKRITFQSDKEQYLNKRQLRYIGNNPLFPLTFGKIYECDWMEHGMYWITDDKNEEYLYPLYVFEIVNAESDCNYNL